MNARKKKKLRSAFGRANVHARTGRHGGAQDTAAQRIAALEEAVEALTWRAFYDRYPEIERAFVPAPGGKERYVMSTGDGWVVMMLGGTRTSVASGTKVLLDSSAGGRDAGVIAEGALQGRRFDVTSGYVVPAYPRNDNLMIRVGKRAGGPVVVDGVSYDLELNVAYSEGGAAKTAGPFPAKTDPGNPTPSGDHALDIPDYPHGLGAGYGPHGTVWFRIGHSGDRYLHPGHVSAGCLTCAPNDWDRIYGIVHRARANDGQSVGMLKMI
jgi:hypothetical protein